MGIGAYGKPPNISKGVELESGDPFEVSSAGGGGIGRLGILSSL